MCLFLLFPYEILFSHMKKGDPRDWVGVVLGVLFGVGWGVGFGVGFIFAFFRLDNWLIGLLAGPQGRLFPRITPLPLPGLTSTLQQWLQQDWETAINNLNQYLRYSRQFIPVLVAVNRVLSQFPEDLRGRIK